MSGRKKLSDSWRAVLQRLANGDVLSYYRGTGRSGYGSSLWKNEPNVPAPNMNTIYALALRGMISGSDDSKYWYKTNYAITEYGRSVLQHGYHNHNNTGEHK